ncbi:unnamed protein product [Closterium sp. Yama58-4]|nr:unnamed protein product [Closterium sp. Yama58-4]
MPQNKPAPIPSLRPFILTHQRQRVHRQQCSAAKRRLKAHFPSLLPTPVLHRPVAEGSSSAALSGCGSGFIISSAQRLVLTNAHVVDGAARVTLLLPDSRRFATESCVLHPSADLAVLKVTHRLPAKTSISASLPSRQGATEAAVAAAGRGEGTNAPLAEEGGVGSRTEDWLPCAPIGDSDDVELADWVISVGNPVGLPGSISLGVISSLKRTAAQVGVPHSSLHFFQTDCAINPGSSGSPLVNEFGEVIGITTAIRSDAEGVAFAIPINHSVRFGPGYTASVNLATNPPSLAVVDWKGAPVAPTYNADGSAMVAGYTAYPNGTVTGPGGLTIYLQGFSSDAALFTVGATTVLRNGTIVDSSGRKLVPVKNPNGDGSYTAGDLTGWPNGFIIGSGGAVINAGAPLTVTANGSVAFAPQAAVPTPPSTCRWVASRWGRAAQDRAAQDRAAQDRAAQDRAAQDRAAQDRAAQGRAAQDRAAHDRAAQDRAAQDRAAQDRAAQDRAAQGRAAQDRAAQDRAAQDRAAQDRAAQDRAAQDRQHRIERHRIERHRIERHRIERHRIERHRI